MTITLNFNNGLNKNIDSQPLICPPKKRTAVRGWDKGDLSAYYFRSYDYLHEIQLSVDTLLADCDFFKCTHWHNINAYYKSLIFALNEAADSCIPKSYVGALKPFLSEELNELKLASIETHHLWLAHGKPNTGIINDIHKDVKYKLAKRKATIISDAEFDDEISELY